MRTLKIIRRLLVRFRQRVLMECTMIAVLQVINYTVAKSLVYYEHDHNHNSWGRSFVMPIAVFVVGTAFSICGSVSFGGIIRSQWRDVGIEIDNELSADTSMSATLLRAENTDRGPQ